MRVGSRIAEGAALAVVGFVLGYVGYAVLLGKHKARNNRAAQSVRGLTPDLVLARCGKPAVGESVERASESGQRVFVYNDSNEGQIVLTLIPEGGGYRLSMVVNGHGNARFITDPAAQADALPCLQSSPK